MATAIIKLVSSVASAVGHIFGYKSSANKQRRDAEKDVEKMTEKKAEKKAEIEAAVYGDDDPKINAIVNELLAPVACTFFAFSILLGCVSQTAPVYVPTDRRIETVTNSIGIVCKAVPNAVFAELLEKAQELKDLKAEMAVDKRLSK